MAPTLRDKMKGLPAARRKKVEARTAALIAEELSLRDLRKALEKTQTSIAKELGIGQDSVSRIEQRSDLLISTLGEYVQAMGGKLRLVAEFPNRPPVDLQGLSAVKQKPTVKPKKASPKSKGAGTLRHRHGDHGENIPRPD